MITTVAGAKLEGRLCQREYRFIEGFEKELHEMMRRLKDQERFLVERVAPGRLGRHGPYSDHLCSPSTPDLQTLLNLENHAPLSPSPSGSDCSKLGIDKSRGSCDCSDSERPEGESDSN
mmetsp:Transcript_57186/g.90903  ORF Transcript_57186/g.90903 Transcript_57186/m.90903 type:complete len:119 (+) Transcript_57186:60-416(+)